MSDNPYESPQTTVASAAKTVDYSPLLLRGLIVLQLAWIAALGATARGYLPETFFVLGLPLPVMMFGGPALALYLADGLPRLQFAAVAVIQAALFGLQLLALLPAVQ
jgi:hypothetical protein